MRCPVQDAVGAGMGRPAARIRRCAARSSQTPHPGVAESSFCEMLEPLVTKSAVCEVLSALEVADLPVDETFGHSDG